MAGGLKCSKCGGYSAYKTWGFNPSIGRKYTQKLCPSCGNKQPKSYYGRTMTQQEYDNHQAEFHKHLADTLVWGTTWIENQQELPEYLGG